MIGMLGSTPEAAMWDDVEHGSYVADLPLWAELAEGRDPVLDLGCGNGRVALDLAGRGHEVTALDNDPDVLAELVARAEADGVPVTAVDADARDFALGGGFELITAPMQLVQLLRGPRERSSMLAAVRRHLAPGGRFGAAVMDPPVLWGEAEERSLPDVRERDGWVFSSLPLGVSLDGPMLVIERLRQIVSPDGELSESRHDVRLDILEPDRLVAEAREAGFVPVGTHPIPPTDDHVGSVVVVLEPGP